MAIAVALERLGFEVRKAGGGAYVEEVTPASPADGRLTPGDVITSVNEAPAASAQEVTGVLEGASQRGKWSTSGWKLLPELAAPRRLGRRPGTDEPFLGVVLRNAVGRFEFPVDVRIEAEGFEGGSGGLALTLGLLDVLTPGELTGRNRIAVTGTMEIDGTVGKVGGVTEKAISARRAGALFPRAERTGRGCRSRRRLDAEGDRSDHPRWRPRRSRGARGDLGAARRSP